MGRGTILTDLGEGQYSIKLDFGESRLAAQLLLLTGANTDLDTQIAAQQAKVNTAEAALNASNAALSAAINAYVASNSSPNLLPPIEAAKLDQVAKEEALRRETVALGKLQGSKANNLRKIDDLNSYRVSLTLNAWCADYTEGASGEVATLEIPNEPTTVLIAPAGRAPVDADGELRMRALMTAPQAYYNVAILPGWQKFKPTYRSGVITAINGDTADVALDEAKSSSGGIADIGLANIEFDVNQTSTLTNVPIVYQDCNGTAFEVGDAVVVQFMAQSWSAPRIIGFLSNPRQCGPWFVISKTLAELYLPDTALYPITATPASNEAYFGLGGKYHPNTWKANNNYGGDRVWIGANKKVVTWRAGGDPFMYPYVVYNNTVIDCATPEFYAHYNIISANGTRYNFPNGWTLFRRGFVIAGAAIYVENNEDVLYFVCYNNSYNNTEIIYSAIGYPYDKYDIEYLHFYKKNLVTNQLTKLASKEFINQIREPAPPNSGISIISTYPGDMCVALTAQWPLVAGPNSTPQTYGTDATGTYRVSFHPSECKAVCAVYQNYQTGRLEFTPSSTAFFADSGLIAAEYHPDDGRLCTLKVKNYQYIGLTYTLVFSEGNVQFEITSQTKRGFTGDISVCYPLNSVTLTKPNNTYIVTRNFFNGEYTDTKIFSGVVPDFNLPVLTVSLGSETLSLRNTPRLVLIKDKYYAVFYDNSNPSFLFGGVARFISSEFTQANLEANSPVAISDFSGVGILTPMRIGYSKI